MKFFVLAACIAGALARPDGAGHGHGHDHGHSAAAAAPATGYQEPASGYSAPSGSGYEQPGYDQSSGYEQTGYEQSGYETGYPQDSYAVADEGGFSLSMLILPVMILAGLALLFPSVQTVAVKRKRSAEDEVSGNSLVERVQDIYMSVVESEECLERIACEMGGIVADAGISTEIFRTAAPLVSGKFSSAMKSFNNAKDCRKMKCGTLF